MRDDFIISSGLGAYFSENTTNTFSYKTFSPKYATNGDITYLGNLQPFVSLRDFD